MRPAGHHAHPPIRFESPSRGHLGGFHAAVTERAGGTSAPPYASLNLGRSVSDDPVRVTENEERVLLSLELDRPVARLRLEHGARILAPAGPGLHGPADALMTRASDLILWITVADCYPLALVSAEVAILAHCGWRGVAAGIVEAALAALPRDAGRIDPKRRAWLGPGIGACCYEVGPEVARVFPDSIGSGGPDEARPSATVAARTFLDLRGEILRRLHRGGLPETAIEASPLCTSCHPDRFYSHRRDGWPSGRMAALLWRVDASHTP